MDWSDNPMVKPQTVGSKTRMSFSKINEAIDLPNLLEVQKDSFKWFMEEGLMEVLHDVSPITDYTGNLFIEFVDYSFDQQPKYPVEECKERRELRGAPQSSRKTHKPSHRRSKAVRYIHG